MQSDTDSEIISFLPFSHLHLCIQKTVSLQVRRFFSLFGAITAPLIYKLSYFDKILQNYIFRVSLT